MPTCVGTFDLNLSSGRINPIPPERTCYDIHSNVNYTKISETTALHAQVMNYVYKLKATNDLRRRNFDVDITFLEPDLLGS